MIGVSGVLRGTIVLVSAVVVALTGLSTATAEEAPTPAIAETPVVPSEVPSVLPSTPTLDPTTATPVPVDPEPVDPEVAKKKEEAERTSDALPPSAGVSDEYLKQWELLESLNSRLARQQRALDDIELNVTSAKKDVEDAEERLRLARIALLDAQDELSIVVREMYISGTSQADSLIATLGSEPDDLMKNLDSAMYVGAVGNTASAETTDAESAVQVAEIQLASARDKFDEVTTQRDDLAESVENTQAQRDRVESGFLALVSAGGAQTEVDGRGCPKVAPPGTSSVDVNALCRRAVSQAATPQAATALSWALSRLGAPYACGGIGRMDPFRFDCSSYVSRAYAEAGLNTAGDTWAPSTRNMVPWDGVPLDPHYAPIQFEDLRPGDLVLYNTCPSGGCSYRHVVMYLGSNMMAHTNQCGGVAHVAPFWGQANNYLGARRVVALKGEKVRIR